MLLGIVNGRCKLSCPNWICLRLLVIVLLLLLLLLIMMMMQRRLLVLLVRLILMMRMIAMSMIAMRSVSGRMARRSVRLRRRLLCIDNRLRKQTAWLENLRRLILHPLSDHRLLVTVHVTVTR